MSHIETYKILLEEGLSDNNIYLTDHEITLLQIHQTELMKWNRKMNLTTILDPRSVAEKHYIDSLFGHIFFKKPDLKVMDMGTGGGFPGIPLKIIKPDLSMTLLDSSLKKIHFLKHVIRRLGIPNVEAIHSRAQDLFRDSGHSHQYDIVMSRAFSTIESFMALGLPFLTPGGFLLAFKSRQGLEEVKNIDNRLFHAQVHHFVLPFSSAKRCIIKIKPKT